MPPRDPEPSLLAPADSFARRHIGPRDADIEAMLAAVGAPSLEALMAETVPEDIRLRRPLDLGPPGGEHETLAALDAIAAQNRVLRSFIGMGYHGTITPPVIRRNILENPGWYTQYTPYQAEISQGRLEALLTFQTMVADLTGLPMANASLLDEATAAAEAMALCHEAAAGRRTRFFAADHCHPQTLAVLGTRAEALGFRLDTGPVASVDLSAGDVMGILVQYPATDGAIFDLEPLVRKAHAAGALVVVATDLLALALLRPPGEYGADVAVGSAQRFGIPMGYGGPHAAFFATRDEWKRLMPGRIIGVSRDALGNPALRMALQTREQHIRREKATSNICTSQVLLAIMAAMYAVWHGPEGLRDIARRVHGLTQALAAGLRALGCLLRHDAWFDTLAVHSPGRTAAGIVDDARARGINLRALDANTTGIALDETVEASDLRTLLEVFAGPGRPAPNVEALAAAAPRCLPEPFARTSAILTHPVFRSHHSEHEMLRYLRRLENRDLSLTTSMIPLGSCTMKLNATSEMLPVTWEAFAGLHPFAPEEQAAGYRRLIADLESWLAEITGFHTTSLQPNAGSQGEYAGLLVIRAFHRSRGEAHRDVCLIPTSAHGTNPASAVMAGFRVVPVACDARGNVDLADLEARAAEHAGRLAALMITYPSTHGVFEASIRRICDVVHAAGGQVYMDGANMNAQVGLCRPGDFGPDVCHLNLHKTFCIPHGGGGPGVGPIAVARHLAPFLPGHPVVKTGGSNAIGPVAAAPFGSPSILPIPWVYITLMGAAGLKRATEVAILNANYMARRLARDFRILYTGAGGRVAHEFIIDLRPFQKSAGITVDDVAKRLMDYGFHSPTMSFPVAGTMMIEPTESEPRSELDRLCDALIAIRAEIREIEEGRMDRNDNPLRNAPHTAAMVTATEWTHPYARGTAAFPAPWVRDRKFWPHVARIDNAFGDRNVMCTCPPVEAVASPSP